MQSSQSVYQQSLAVILSELSSFEKQQMRMTSLCLTDKRTCGTVVQGEKKNFVKITTGPVEWAMTPVAREFVDTWNKDKKNKHNITARLESTGLPGLKNLVFEHYLKKDAQ